MMRFLVSHLHPISIEDLLERDEIHLDTSKVEPYLKIKSFLLREQVVLLALKFVVKYYGLDLKTIVTRSW